MYIHGASGTDEDEVQMRVHNLNDGSVSDKYYEELISCAYYCCAVTALCYLIHIYIYIYIYILIMYTYK